MENSGHPSAKRFVKNSSEFQKEKEIPQTSQPGQVQPTSESHDETSFSGHVGISRASDTKPAQFQTLNDVPVCSQENTAKPSASKKPRNNKNIPKNVANNSIENADIKVLGKSDAKKQAKRKNGEGTTKNSPQQEKPELTAIPQTNFAIGLMVLCCFNLPFGLLALYFSLRAAAAYRDGKKMKGASRARISILLSLVGIMLTMVIVSSVVVYIAVAKHSKRSTREQNSSALGL